MDNLWDELCAMDIEDTTFTEREVIEMELDALGLAKEAATDFKQKREKELELLKAFKKAPSPQTFEPLYNSFEPLIMSAAQKNIFGSPIPKAAHKMLAAQSFLDATRTWNPSKGSFNTHAVNAVFNKGKRLNLKYQNFGYIPEDRGTKYQAFQTALHVLREDLGREPSTLEIADEMALPVEAVEKFQKESRKSYLETERSSMKGPSFAQSDKVLQIAHDFMHELIPAHQIVMEYTLGLNGKPSLTKATGGADVAAIAKATNQSTASVRSALKSISKRMRAHRGGGFKTDIEEIFGGEING